MHVVVIIRTVYFLLLGFYSFVIISAFGNSAGKLCHPRSDAYSAKQGLLNKQQVSGGVAISVSTVT